MIGEINKKFIIDFLIAALGLIDERIIAISFNNSQNQLQFTFYLIEQNEEINDTISDILFEFEALQDDFIRLEKCEVVINNDFRYTLKKNELGLVRSSKLSIG